MGQVDERGRADRFQVGLFLQPIEASPCQSDGNGLRAQMGFSPPSIGMMAALSVISMGVRPRTPRGVMGEQGARGLLA